MTDSAAPHRLSRATGRTAPFAPRRFQVYTDRTLDSIPQLAGWSPERRFEMRVVASVLPFRVNEYVVNDLIDWERADADPIFHLVFPQRGMLAERHFDAVAALHRAGADADTLADAIADVRKELNPHPAGQLSANVPLLDGRPLPGLQHKYRETVLFFPAQGQTCHSYCSFCFRWAQFVGVKELRIAAKEAEQLLAYLRRHREITDVLITGGDPLVMKTRSLRAYVEPLLSPEFDHVRTIRIGSKSLTFWPYRFVTDDDADDLLRLFEEVVASGKHLALMAHYNHPRELETAIAREAIGRVRATGAQIRSQGPLLANVNDDHAVWAELWRRQVRLGIVPYYMFVERDTGARNYFEVPLADAARIFRHAIRRVSGVARTVRGPSMSADPGKVEVTGTAEIAGEKVFVLRFLQGRDPAWVQRPFFARYDEDATWLDHLRPAFGAERFFFEAG